MPLIDKQVEPFNPKKHEPKDVGLGGPSTEYLITVDAPDGGVMVIPSIWWDSKGEPTLVDQKEAIKQASKYEESSGKQFPRFAPKAYEKADEFARNRSASGGATQGELASKPSKSLLK
jgi:hypothetical protein